MRNGKDGGKLALPVPSLVTDRNPLGPGRLSGNVGINPVLSDYCHQKLNRIQLSD